MQSKPELAPGLVNAAERHFRALLYGEALKIRDTLFGGPQNKSILGSMFCCGCEELWTDLSGEMQKMPEKLKTNSRHAF